MKIFLIIVFLVFPLFAHAEIYTTYNCTTKIMIEIRNSKLLDYSNPANPQKFSFKRTKNGFIFLDSDFPFFKGMLIHNHEIALEREGYLSMQWGPSSFVYYSGKYNYSQNVSHRILSSHGTCNTS